MGKGKGNVEYWVAPIQPGRVLYEIQGVTEEAAREAFRLASAKLAVKNNICDPVGDVMNMQEIRIKSEGDLRSELSEPVAGAIQSQDAKRNRPVGTTQ